jgi:hypothetical protein
MKETPPEGPAMSERSKIGLTGLRNKVDFTRFSTLSLLFSNLLVILIAVIDKLSAADVLWIYWSQSVIIGIFNTVEILTLKEFSTAGFRQGNRPVLPTKAAKYSTAVFFLFHYGFFHFVYAVFLGVFSHFAGPGPSGRGRGFIFYSAAIFLARYLIDFVTSRNIERREIPNLGRMMFAPYVRIIPMHLTIILGALIGVAGSFSAGADLAILVLFTGIKTVVDLITDSVDLAAAGRRDAGTSVERPG